MIVPRALSQINIRSIFSGRASLATSTLTFQVAMLLFLFVLKIKMPDTAFGIFLVGLGTASILGAVASLRSEVLITQKDGAVNKRTLLWPINVAVAVVVASYVFVYATKPLLNLSLPAETIALSFGFSLQATCQFVLIQECKFLRLLQLRLAQVVLLAITALFVFLGTDVAYAAWGFAAALTLPFAIWAAYWLVRKQTSHERSFAFAGSQLRRSAMLSLTLLINTSAVNIPIILCVATQDAGYSADFGFMLKIFGAAATLANAVFGQLFMADNIKRDISVPAQARIVIGNMRSTTVKALIFVSLLSAATVIIIFLAGYILPGIISRPSLALAIAIAVIAQAGFSPVSAIGDIAKLENPFLFFYIARLTILSGILWTQTNIDYALRFGLINVAVYGAFWLYADHRLQRFAA